MKIIYNIKNSSHKNKLKNKLRNKINFLLNCNLLKKNFKLFKIYLEQLIFLLKQIINKIRFYKNNKLRQKNCHLVK